MAPILSSMPAAPLTGLNMAWLDFSGSGMNDAEVTAAFNEAARVCRPVDVILTTQQPGDRMPGSYVTCRIIPDVVIPWQPEDAGVSPVHLSQWAVLNVHLQCYVCRGGADPVLVGSRAAHEFAGHVLAFEDIPHSPSGVFNGSGDIRGLDFLPGDVAYRNQWAYEIARGRRFGYFQDGPPSYQYRRDWYDIGAIDPNWRLPVFTPGRLIFAAGYVPPCVTVPAGWTMGDGSQSGGKLVLDFGSQTVYHPGPVPGTPGQYPAFTFGPGPAPLAEWGPDRGGGLKGWVNRRGGAGLVIDPATRTVTRP